MRFIDFHRILYTVGVDINEGNNVFSQDLTEYEKFDDAVNSAIIEGISYLSLKKNDRKV